MADLALQRIPFSSDADTRLRMLKARTGITANILCRMGFSLSLEETGVPALLQVRGQIGREINRYTLLGRYDRAFVSLLATRMKQDDIGMDMVDKMFIAHMNRGVELLAARMRSLADVGTLATLPSSGPKSGTAS